MKKSVKICLTLLTVFLFSLCFSGCEKAADRKELAEWFREEYTREDMGLAKKPGENRNRDKVYGAYLKCDPKLKFYIWSEYQNDLFAGHYENKTDFSYVYGKYYFENYCKEHPVKYAVPSKDNSSRIWFCLDLVYENRQEMKEARDEIASIQVYMEQQEIPVDVHYGLWFNSPADPEALYHNLFFDRKEKTVEPVNSEDNIKKAEAELAAWTAYYRICMDWFTPEEQEVLLKYARTKEYDAYNFMTDLVVYKGEERYEYPQWIVKSKNYISFGLLYELLAESGWESLEGSVEDFHFIGADGAEYRFSYNLYDVEISDGNGITYKYKTCAFFKDGEQIEQRNGDIPQYIFREATNWSLGEPEKPEETEETQEN